MISVHFDLRIHNYIKLIQSINCQKRYNITQNGLSMGLRVKRVYISAHAEVRRLLSISCIMPRNNNIRFNIKPDIVNKTLAKRKKYRFNIL